MDYERSTQAKSWIFSEQSIDECRKQAASAESFAMPRSPKPRVRKFASGFQRRSHKKHDENMTTILSSKSLATTKDSESPVSGLSCTLSSNDQESLVQFHAHQIQRLVGPSAIYPELERSASVLSTAIMLFRRFYLSNSIIDFHPRSIAVASAFLAVKVDCEEKLEIGLLAHATSVIYHRAPNAPLFRHELRIVTIDEIEDAERTLLEGLNYELRCHHPYGAIRMLSSDVTSFLMSSADHEHKPSSGYNDQYGYVSPRAVESLGQQDSWVNLCERALGVAQSALVYSDVCFLFAPGKIAFAAVAIALEGVTGSQRLGFTMRKYLKSRFSKKTEEELLDFEGAIARIIDNLAGCRSMDLNKFCCNIIPSSDQNARLRAAEVHHAFALASRLRNRHVIASAPGFVLYEQCRKRRRVDGAVPLPLLNHKIAKVTPIRSQSV